MIEVKREHLIAGVNHQKNCLSACTYGLTWTALSWCKALQVANHQGGAGTFSHCDSMDCRDCGLAQIEGEIGNVTEQSINQQLKDFGVVIVTSEQG